jgi:hypothetical protein
MFKKRYETAQPLEKLWVPVGWGDSIIACIIYSVMSVRLPTPAEFKEGFRSHQIFKLYLGGKEVWAAE